ncbi:type I polyketide synthase [Stieleria varia]|uniref:Mycocerosic acid synthase n=1 Tax=Stieleria varia TaxID=2528005 RepID=A0A5C6AGU9_9BACT|nr:type I polyketide synthase [Stieleria varia]TWT98528.1 Mycocerosic acid synthase [Stieleria varia]
MGYFATEYTIHFDDTMAYGGHHFLTAFKFQCAARETFMFGEHIFDVPGVKAALNGVHLLTSDAYSRNLHSTQLGDRVAILLTLEDWGRVSARFCYRVIDAQGRPISAGFQTLICADAKTGEPIPLPPPLRQAMDALREIEEKRPVDDSFRDCVLAGGGKLDSIFGDRERAAAVHFLSQRYSRPAVLSTPGTTEEMERDAGTEQSSDGQDAVTEEREAWVFAGQGAFDAELFCERIIAYSKVDASTQAELKRCSLVAREFLGGDAEALVSGNASRVRAAIDQTSDLLQVAIHLQNVLGGLLWRNLGHRPTVLLGHSFGEIAAMGLGGCFDLPTGVQIVCMRADAINKHAPPRGGLAVISASRHEVRAEAMLLGLDRISIAGRNHEQQTVASGPIDQLNRLQEFFQSLGVGAATIPSPTSFHHPDLRQAAFHWLQQLRGVTFNIPTHSIYSPIGRRFLNPNDDVASTLVSQLLRPFDLQGGITDVVAAGITQFVDCGSTGSLARLIDKGSKNDVKVCHVQTIPELPLSAGADTATTTSTLGRDVPPSLGAAIVGQGCILPAGVSSPGQLYAALAEQRLGIVDQRDHDPHWSEDFYSETLVADRSTSHLAGRVNEEDICVPLGVDPIVFEGFTRTQRLLCIALAPCVAALEDAERVICLIGATADGFEDQDEVSSLLFAGIDPSSPEVNRRLAAAKSGFSTPHDALQEVFDKIVRPGLKLTLVDAACASSLYTMALGMRALESDKADAVIAGGVFCPGPGNSCLFSQFHGTTSTGCRPFDAGADGVVFSEGAALVTLRRHADAQRLGLAIQATVRGVGLSSDGRSPSANVPQSSGQVLSLQRCYENYRIDPASIQAIEAHGTSTAVGDSTELETLRRFFETHASSPIPVHSLKGSLGHAGWAAGTASVIAACEYLRRGTFPAQAFHRQPSDALKKCHATLTVPTRPVSLQQPNRRIAIDGFGFGGANAHLVIENFVRDDLQKRDSHEEPVIREDSDQDLVIVAHHRVTPTVQTTNGLVFDREIIKLPDGCLVLPELADDMDISQSLAVILGKQIIDQLPDFDDALRRDTSLILAMRGKTERGIEATARIMAPRLRRDLQGDEHSVALLDRVNDHSRPSGPYTLQCMMPNVATGRAALLLNLNGPNFVVDSGRESLSAAFESAALLLRGNNDGAKLAIVAAIQARSSQAIHWVGAQESEEFASAFGVTTRQFAQSQGWSVIAGVDEALTYLLRHPDNGDSTASMRDQVEAIADWLSPHSTHPSTKLKSSPATIQPPADPECLLHTPVWIEKRLSEKRSRSSLTPIDSLIAIAPANANLVSRLCVSLPKLASRFLIAIVGDSASEIASTCDNPNVIPVDQLNESMDSVGLQRIQELNANVVVGVDAIQTWGLLETLSSVSSDNGLCELMFLIARQNIQRLQRGEMELWGVFQDAYNGRAHPRSGSIAGLLKSIHREIPSLRCGTICTQGIGLTQAMENLMLERSQQDLELEIAYDQRVRLVRRLCPVPQTSHPSPQVVLDSGSVVVASGGGRGVTCVMLEEIARSHQCTVIALGRSPLEAGPDRDGDADVQQQYYQQFLLDHPGASAREMKKSFELARARWEAHRNITTLKNVGGRVEYMAVDVTDRTQVAEAVTQIVEKYGKIDLLIHGAGVQYSKRLEDRTLDEFRATFAAKVSGLNHLVQCCQTQLGRTVSTHVLTSAYSVFGNDGQHDYGAANETMDRLCSLSRIGNLHRWSSIAWLAWDGIGMTRGSEYRALAKQRSLSGVGSETGQRLFRDVLDGRTDSAINVPVSDAEHIQYQIKTVPLRSASGTGRKIEVSIDLSSIECLPFHKVRNTPTLPGAWILDRLVFAGLQLCSDSDRMTQVTVEDATFKRFVRLVNEQDPNVRVIAEQRDDAIHVSMLVDVIHPSGQLLAKDVVSATARLSFSAEQTLLSSVVHGPNSSDSPGLSRFVNDPYCHGDSGEVDLSGPFDCLREIEIGAAGRRATFNPEISFDSVCDIPALLLDAAWRVAAVYAVSWKNELFVPVHIRRMVIPLSGRKDSGSARGWEMRSTLPMPEGQDVRWDRTEVIDDKGVLRLVVENGLAKRLV